MSGFTDIDFAAAFLILSALTHLVGKRWDRADIYVVGMVLLGAISRIHA
jgi:hypothetical protein